VFRIDHFQTKEIVMKTRAMLAAVLATAAAGLIVGGVLAADAAKDDAKVKEKIVIKCPVSGESVDSMGGKIAVDFEGGKVFFCCDKCPPAFKKDPAKYMAKAHLQMVQTNQLKEVACPFTGKPLNPETAIDVGGVKVAFCCKDCMAKAAKAKGDEQVSLVFKDVSKGFKLAKEEAKK
jgi:YHS domain-containing protein